MSEQITGVVSRIDQKSHVVTVKSDRGIYIIPGERRIKLGFGNHGCIVLPGDVVSFDQPANGNTVLRAYFTKPPDVQLDSEELSQVSAIRDGLVFGTRVKPNCGCGILLGWAEEFPDFNLGDLVRHGLGIDDHGRPKAINVKLETATAVNKEGSI
jgi:hypothetical protein